MNVVDDSWTFKCKQFQKGTVKKSTSCFYACGDQWLEGIDFFERHAPVVQKTTVCLVLIV